MTTHAPAIELSHDQPPLPNQHFSSWLRGQTTLFVSQIVAILGFVSFIASLIYYVANLGQHSDWLVPETVILVVDYTHVVFMAVFVVVLIQILDDNDRGSYRVRLVYERVFGKQEDDPFFNVQGRTFEGHLKNAKKQLKKFKHLLLLFWIGMLFLYVFFACKHSYELATRPPAPPASSAATPAEGGDHGAKKKHLRARVAPARPTEEAPAPALEPGASEPKPGESATPESASPNLTPAPSPTPPDSHPLSGPEVVRELAFPFIVFAFNNFTLLLIFLCFLVLHIPSDKMSDDYRRHRNVSALIILGLTFLYPALVPVNVGAFTAVEWKAYSSVFDTLSGVINAIALALLIARLDSKLIGLPSWLISILYSYAAVQPLFIVFELSESNVLKQITTSVLIFVFVSKIYFFLIIIYALQTGKMLNYLFCFPILREHAKDAGGANTRQSQVTSAAHAGHAPEGGKKEEEEEVEGRVVRLFARCDRYAYKWLGRGGRRLARVRGRLSLWLRSERPLKVSQWLGLVTVCYFFISLIAFLIIPKNVCGAWGISWFCQDAARIRTGYSYLLNPNGGDAGLKGSFFNVVIDFLQLLFVSGIIVTLYLLRKESRHGGHGALAKAALVFGEAAKPKYPPEKAQKQLKKFKEYFLYFWCVTFLLYVVILLKHLKVVFFACEGGSVSFHHFLHAHESPTEFLCQQGSIAYLVQTLLYPFLEFLLGTLNLLFAFWCFVVLRSPAFDKRAGARQSLLVRYSSLVVALLIAVFPLLLFRIGGPALSKDRLTEYATVFDGVTGTLSAVVLALLIARMDSRLFGLSRWLIGMLFAYASIQPLFIAFALDVRVLEMVQTSVLTAALGLKICFFLVIAHSLQGGKMLGYVVGFPFLRERVDSIFENQFEIRLARAEHESFTFSILKKNVPYYSTERRFKTRRACDAFVKLLRRRMENPEAYGEPQEAEGTYWVEVRANARSAKGRLLCESIPLRSEDDARHLIEESLDKIPYCKYNRA